MAELIKKQMDCSKTEKAFDKTPIINFGEGEWRLRYYEEKFHVKRENLTGFLKDIRRAYLEGLCWVFSYYYESVPSWDWYYPYHYAPLAVDLLKFGEDGFKFDIGEPYKPIE